MTYLMLLHEPECTRTDWAGGKGASLGRLTNWGFPVPGGAVVSSRAYQAFLGDASDIASLLAEQPQMNQDALRLLAEKIQLVLEQRPLPPGLREEIPFLLQSFPASTTFAVRSSATLEDTATAAFAGQHETFLNCRGLDQILKNIKACWISLWSHRAVAYRQQQGFNHFDSAMAVVVQCMELCDTAGVGFSLDPVSGQLDRMVFDANFGLGESVVGGEGEVDHFVVDKASLAILEQRVAHKTRQVVAVDGGVKQQSISPEHAAQPCLDQARLTRLATMLRDVEQRAGFPQDIEWGFRGDKVFLLQARPVTTVPPHWTREESAERFPNVITPLTWDLVEEGFHRSLNFSFHRMGFPPFSGKWFALHDHYVYGNQNAVKLYARRNAAAPKTLDELRAAIPFLRQHYAWVQELPVAWSRDLDRYLIGIGELLAEPLADKTLPEIWNFILRVQKLGSDYFLPNIAISITQGSLYRLLHHLLELVIGKEKGRSLFDDLLAFCETKTGIINRELHGLTELMRREPNLVEVLGSGTSQELLSRGLLTRFPNFAQTFNQFLENHGHREVDFDPYHPTWLEAPWLVLDALRLILKSVPNQSLRERERSARIRMLEAERQMLAAFPEDLHFFCVEVVRLTRIYTTLDDLEHYQTTRITLPFRKGLREMGRRLVERNILSEEMDVFFCRFTDLDVAVRQNDTRTWDTLSHKIRSNKTAYLERRYQSPPWDLRVAESENTEVILPQEGTLHGLPGSPGVVEGCVYRVTGEKDFAKFPAGAVLLARTTNPAWTPLFYASVAVITESGGPLSHGAVTAREMGIPAVMGVRNVFQHLENGQRVRVDGGKGTIHLLS
ncbi:MAG: PEP-utilizing enzyme [Magnetococcus sp. DMHC-1]